MAATAKDTGMKVIGATSPGISRGPPCAAFLSVLALFTCAGACGSGDVEETREASVPTIQILAPSDSGTYVSRQFLGGKNASVHVGGIALASADSFDTYHCECWCGLACLEWPNVDPGCTTCSGSYSSGVEVQVTNASVGFAIQATRSVSGPGWWAEVPATGGLNVIEAVADARSGLSASARIEYWVVPPGPFAAVAAGRANSYALLGGGALFGCGLVPWTQPVMRDLDHGEWLQVSSGEAHTLAIRSLGSAGELMSWGANESAQLGVDDPTLVLTSPRPVSAGLGWAAVAAGWDHSLGVMDDGTLWGWGGNEFGQAGRYYSAAVTSPARIGIASDWSSVAAGYMVSFGIKSDGSLWRWGAWLGTNEIEPTQALDFGFIGPAWRAISVRSTHAVGVRGDGTLWSMGTNDRGQLGLGSVGGSARYPRRIGWDTDWAAVAAGDRYSLALKTDGSLWAWGANGSGQLGLGSGDAVAVPTRVGVGTWSAIAAGSSHSIGIAADGSLWSWGSNVDGQLGDGSGVDQRTPTALR